MPAPDKVTVRNTMKKRNRGVVLRRAMEDAWVAVKANPDKSWWRRKTTRAELIWEHSVQNAVVGFADDPEVQIISHHDTVSFVFDDAVLVRVKKADFQLRTRNFPTTQASLFHEHNADLFGHVGLQRVEAVYVFNRFETELDWIGIVAQERTGVLWRFELGAEEIDTVVEFPVVARSEPAADRVLKIRTKTTGDGPAIKKDQ
jgi:hypothetical protein